MTDELITIVPAEQVTKAYKTLAQTWAIWHSKDEANPKLFPFEYDVKEQVLITAGSAKVVSENGTSFHLRKGDGVTFHKGFKATWHIIQPVTKYYLWHEMTCDICDHECLAESYRWGMDDLCPTCYRYDQKYKTAIYQRGGENWIDEPQTTTAAKTNKKQQHSLKENTRHKKKKKAYSSNQRAKYQRPLPKQTQRDLAPPTKSIKGATNVMRTVHLKHSVVAELLELEKLDMTQSEFEEAREEVLRINKCPTWKTFSKRQWREWREAMPQFKAMIDAGVGHLKRVLDVHCESETIAQLEAKREQTKQKPIKPTSTHIIVSPSFSANSPVSKDDFNSLVQRLKEKDTMKQVMTMEIGQHINGAWQIKVDPTKRSCDYSRLIALLNKQPSTHPLCPTASQIHDFLSEVILKGEGMKDAKYKLDSVSLLVQHEHTNPQPVHSDVKNMKWAMNENGLGEMMQGTLMLTENTLGTTLYNMDNVPMYPTMQKLMAQLSILSPNAGDPGNKLLKIEIQNNPPLQEELSQWGRLIYASADRRVESEIAEQFSLTLMHGNHPHAGPGLPKSRDELFRLCLFITAKPPGTPEKTNYNYTQMTREKLFYSMILGLKKKWKNEKTLKTDEHKILLQYLHTLFVDAVIETGMNGTEDGTIYGDLTRRQSADILEILKCVESYREHKTPIKKGILDQARSKMITNNM